FFCSIGHERLTRDPLLLGHIPNRIVRFYRLSLAIRTRLKEAQFHHDRLCLLTIPHSCHRQLIGRPLAAARITVRYTAMRVQTKRITRLTSNARSSKVMPLALRQLQTEPLTQHCTSLSSRLEVSTHRSPSHFHSARRGQSARTQS